MFSPDLDLEALLRRRPAALAFVHGSGRYPSVLGTVSFYQTEQGVVVVADISGLPMPEGKDCAAGSFFAFHIHAGASCSGNAADPFVDALAHFDPGKCKHPEHAGDLPPLLSNDGRAFSAVLTDRFSVREVVGRTVVIHRNPDDFTTQPSGNAGEKIACGVIRI